MLKKEIVYRMSLPKGDIVLFGELQDGDIAFIKEWLDRIEAAQQSVERT